MSESKVIVGNTWDKHVDKSGGSRNRSRRKGKGNHPVHVAIFPKDMLYLLMTKNSPLLGLKNHLSNFPS